MRVGAGHYSMSKTISEQVFEEYCVALGIPFSRIPETTTRTPPYYELTCDSQRIIVEVKEITPNEEEQESERLLAERGWGNATGGTPGERVRQQKIAACSKQIKARTDGVLPTMLVVFDRGRQIGHVEAYQIRVAMYGLEQIHIAVPPIGAGSPYASRRDTDLLHQRVRIRQPDWKCVVLPTHVAGHRSSST
jgi:hypothetical protein